jgi:hypothetical protein
MAARRSAMEIEESGMAAFKRIVTGHDADGRAVIAMQGPPPNAFPLKAVPGTVFHEIWNTSGSPAAVDNGADPTLKALQLGPPASGSLIRVVDIPPDTVQNAVSAEDAAAAFEEIGAGHAGTGKSDSPHRLMHRTETIDYGIVLAGKVWLVLDADEVELHPGDIVVQRGTNHAWSNRTDAPVRMAFVLLDGRFSPEIA